MNIKHIYNNIQNNQMYGQILTYLKLKTYQLMNNFIQMTHR